MLGSRISAPRYLRLVDLVGDVACAGWPDDDGSIEIVALSQALLFGMVVAVSGTDLAALGVALAATLNVVALAFTIVLSAVVGNSR